MPDVFDELIRLRDLEPKTNVPLEKYRYYTSLTYEEKEKRKVEDNIRGWMKKQEEFAQELGVVFLYINRPGMPAYENYSMPPRIQIFFNEEVPVENFEDEIASFGLKEKVMIPSVYSSSAIEKLQGMLPPEKYDLRVHKGKDRLHGDSPHFGDTKNWAVPRIELLLREQTEYTTVQQYSDIQNWSGPVFQESGSFLRRTGWFSFTKIKLYSGIFTYTPTITVEGGDKALIKTNEMDLQNPLIRHGLDAIMECLLGRPQVG